MGKRKRRTRRSFSPEFKAETVRLVQGSEKSLGTIARELDLTETALRAWVRQAEVDAGRGRAGALTTDEREELARLRRDVKRLQMERDILKNLRVRGGRTTCWTRNSRAGYRCLHLGRSGRLLIGDVANP